MEALAESDAEIARSECIPARVVRSLAELEAELACEPARDQVIAAVNAFNEKHGFLADRLSIL
jgi:hypothetical protein